MYSGQEFTIGLDDETVDRLGRSSSDHGFAQLGGEIRHATLGYLHDLAYGNISESELDRDLQNASARGRAGSQFLVDVPHEFVDFAETHSFGTIRSGRYDMAHLISAALFTHVRQPDQSAEMPGRLSA